MTTDEELQDKIAQKLAQATQAQEEAEEQITETATIAGLPEDAKGRQSIGVTVTALFVAVIVGIALIEVFQAPKTAAASIGALLTDFVYPVLLLVVGYYFGKSTAED